ncbi:hypothetical protein ACLHWY_14770 [Priestia aryabhattai]|uniref:hypothetical protein n=1 Tax=Priestia TaxID=2800373 RepID=UPI003983816F
MKTSAEAQKSFVQIPLKGKNILSRPYLNKGSAFTKREREELKLDRVLPPTVLTLEEQVQRAYQQFKNASKDLQKNNLFTLLTTGLLLRRLE